jgi:thiol-disulfide isomerase/thioredoxin
MRVLLPVLCVSWLLTGLSAQQTAKEVFDTLTASQKEVGRDRGKAEAFQASAKEALQKHSALLADGDGIYYRGRIELMTRDQKAATESFKAYLDKHPDSDLAHETRVIVAQLTQREDNAGARKLLAAVKADKLGTDSKSAFDGLTKNFKAEDTRNGLTDKDAPAIPAQKVLNAAEWSLAGSKGKVVVVDFWATWCPPCRGIIPSLVKMQEKHATEGLQIVGVTKYYGSGMDFAPDSELPHGGKTVGGRKGSGKEMTPEQEIAVNENFIKAFKVNYPIVFTDENLAGDKYGVMGIPTCYVIGRDGKVVGHVVGGDPESHAKLEKMIAGALGKGAAEATGKKSGD